MLELSRDQTDEIPVELATQMIDVLSVLSAEFGLSWNVGHQFEPQLGTIVNGTPTESLWDEIRTAVQTARSLSGIIIDDEFIEPDSTFEHDEETTGLGDDQSWNDVFESPDKFIRFPEWE